VASGWQAQNAVARHCNRLAKRPVRREPRQARRNDAYTVAVTSTRLSEMLTARLPTRAKVIVLDGQADSLSYAYSMRRLLLVSGGLASLRESGVAYFRRVILNGISWLAPWQPRRHCPNVPAGRRRSKGQVDETCRKSNGDSQDGGGDCSDDQDLTHSNLACVGFITSL
jgi:hypothetical protein